MKQVRRIVHVLQDHEPIVTHTERRLNAIAPLFALEADVIDVVAARREGTYRLRHLARPADIGAISAGSSQTAPQPHSHSVAMTERCFRHANSVRRVAQLLEIYQR